MLIDSRMRFVPLLITAGALVWGCSSTQPPPQPSGTARPQASESTAARSRERALDHFIRGSLHDAKGEYANAILEYQDALRYDQDPAIHFALARDYSLIGKHALAAQHGSEAVRQDPRNITYRENLASIYLNAFEQEKAIQQYEEILRIDSNSTNAWYALARLYQGTRPLRSLDLYDRLIDREGETWDLLLQTAEICAGLGRWDQAADRYRRLLALDPGNRPLQRQLAETYARAGQVDSAIALLEMMVEVNDSDLETQAVLADVYLERREFSRALPLYERILARGADNSEIRIRVGVAYFGHIPDDSTFIPKARSVFEELVPQIPRDWRPYWYLGALASMSGHDSSAARYFEKVTSLEERNFEAWWFLATYRFDRQEYAEAIRLMERAQRIFPEESRVPFLMGAAYAQMGDRARAIESLERSLRLKPDDLNALSSLALTYNGMEEFARSDSLYEEALRINPDFHLVLNNYSYSLAERGLQLERALVMALKAVEAEPENAAYLDTLGWIYFKLGNYVEAERFVAKAVAAGEASAVVYEHLGDVYVKLGRTEKALEYWQMALERGGSPDTLNKKIEEGKRE